MPERSLLFMDAINKRAMQFFHSSRSINLKPLEWTTAIGLTGVASPYIGEVLDAAFANAQAIVVLMTPDDIVYLSRDLVACGQFR